MNDNGQDLGKKLGNKIKRIISLLLRFWNIYIMPPKEANIYLENISELPILSQKISDVKTGSQPKQVESYDAGKKAFVTCMEGRTLQVFDYSNSHKIRLTKSFYFDEKCVEAKIFKGHCFFTTTNFKEGRAQTSHLYILDIKTLQIIGKTSTLGEWSKIISINPNGKELAISNWKSNNISIIDISNMNKPSVIQVVPINGESPAEYLFFLKKDSWWRVFIQGRYILLRK